MPLVIHPRVRKGLARLVAMTVMGVFASTGMAMACASPPPVSQPFAQFGDTSNYFLLAGGDFEGTHLPRWRLDNAVLTRGNEPFYVHSSADSQSVTINSGGSVTSPMFCVDSTMPKFRFFARQVAAGSDLKVEVISFTRRFLLTREEVARLADGSGSNWAPAQGADLASVLDLPTGASYPVVIRFVDQGTGSWQIDDVYVDPWSFG